MFKLFNFKLESCHRLQYTYMMDSRYVKRDFKQPQQEQYMHTPSKHTESRSRHGDQKQSPAIVAQEQKHKQKSQHNPLPKKHLPPEALNGKDANYARATREYATLGSPKINGSKTDTGLHAHRQATNNNSMSAKHEDHNDHRHQLCAQGGSLGRFQDGDAYRHDEPAQASKIVPYKQRSTKSLLEDDDDEEASVRDRFLQGIPVPHHNNRNEDKLASLINAHPDLQSVLEVFPNANPGRVLHLLRQESLTATLLLLAEESSEIHNITTCCPSDELLLPPDLTHATTYAQGNDEHRAIIMTYLTEMFPKIPRIEIEPLLMCHSTHKTVTILAEWSSGEVLKKHPPPPPAFPAGAVIPATKMAMKHAPPMPSRRTSDPPHPALLKRRPLRSPIDDDDDDAWRPSHHRTEQ